ncbi:hypothetical protein GCM10023334_107120 [Nonomuraea thailandensis]
MGPGPIVDLLFAPRLDALVPYGLGPRGRDVLAGHLPQRRHGLAGGGIAPSVQAGGAQAGEDLPHGELVREAVPKLGLRPPVVGGQLRAQCGRQEQVVHRGQAAQRAGESFPD